MDKLSVKSELKKLMRYDPSTGYVFWQERPSRNVKTGDQAGHVDHNGYLRIQFRREKYLCHRVAWLLMTGEWPSKFVDHINGCKTDNRWSNLREADRHQNGANQGNRRSNTTGFKGVSRIRKSGKFQAQIRTESGKFYLGQFPTAELAHQAYCAAASEMHKEFANHG